MTSSVAGRRTLPEAADMFRCKRCGDCCIGYGGTFISDDQIASIADFVGLDRDVFLAEKCRLSGGKPVLSQGENGYCIFWDRVCTIYPVRPDMCRKWPFIESILRDVGNWSAMAGSCPGIRVGVDKDALRECVGRVVDRCSRGI